VHVIMSIITHYFQGGAIRLPPAVVPGATQCRPMVKATDGMDGMLWNLDCPHAYHGQEGLLRNAVHELALLKSLAAGGRAVGTDSRSTTDAAEGSAAETPAFVPKVKLAFVGAVADNLWRRGFHIVTEEACDGTLTSFMDSRREMDAGLLQSLSRQLIAAVGHLHSRGVVHRLLCRSCIKLDAQGHLRIAGLQAACVPFAGVRPMCIAPWEYAGHYKAPELMLGIGEFSPACDMWAVGAIFACMCRYMRIIQDLWPLADQSEIALLFGIFQRLGTPRPPHPLTRLPDFSERFPVWKPMGWAAVEPCIGSAGVQLLTGLTNLDPESRLTASDALCHPFFGRAAGPDHVEEFDDEIIQACCVQGREDWRDAQTSPAIEEVMLETNVAQVTECSSVAADAVVPEMDLWHKFQCSAAQWCLERELDVEREDQVRRWVAPMVISTALRRKGSRNLLVRANILSFLYPKGGCPSQDLFAIQTDINAAMRSILVDWLFDVCRKYRHDFGTFCLTVSIVDQHIAQKPVLRRNLQLLGVAAFLVASKVLGDAEESDKICLRKMSYITASAYTAKQVQDMEEELLPLVGSSLITWGPYHFLCHFVGLLKLPPSYVDLARFCLLQSLLLADLSSFSGSLRAASACIIAIKFAADKKELTGTFKENAVALSRMSGRDTTFLKKSSERMWVAVHGHKNLKAMKKMFPDAWKLVSPKQEPANEASPEQEPANEAP